MTLQEWIKKEGISNAEAARRLDVSSFNPSTNIGRWVSIDPKSFRIPHEDNMLKIMRGTNNEVQPNDFYEHIWKINKKF